MKGLRAVSAGAEPAFRGNSSLPRLGLRFGLLYAAIAGSLFAIYGFPFELFGAREDWLRGYLVGYAHLAGAVLSLFERGVEVSGTVIRGRFALEIVRNCDAADVNILFVSALLAFPEPLRKKAWPLALGVLALVAANITRICSLYYVGVWKPAWFKTAHEEVWPLLLVAFAALLFLVTIKRLERSTLGSQAA
jgi:exosortase/archaeosortase family protein